MTHGLSLSRAPKPDIREEMALARWLNHVLAELRAGKRLLDAIDEAYAGANADLGAEDDPAGWVVLGEGGYRRASATCGSRGVLDLDCSAHGPRVWEVYGATIRSTDRDEGSVLPVEGRVADGPCAAPLRQPALRQSLPPVRRDPEGQHARHGSSEARTQQPKDPLQERTPSVRGQLANGRHQANVLDLCEGLQLRTTCPLSRHRQAAVQVVSQLHGPQCVRSRCIATRTKDPGRLEGLTEREPPLTLMLIERDDEEAAKRLEGAEHLPEPRSKRAKLTPEELLARQRERDRGRPLAERWRYCGKCGCMVKGHATKTCTVNPNAPWKARKRYGT